MSRATANQAQGPMRRLRRAISSTARRVADVFPPTMRGVLVLALAAVALVPFGFGSLDLVLFVMGLVGLLLVTVTLVLVAASALWLRRRIAPAPGEPLRLEAGSRIATGLRVPALARVPLVRVHWRWTRPAAVGVVPRRREGARLEEVVAARRCAEPAIRRRFTVHDVLGLCRVSWQVEEKTPVTVLPDIGRLGAMPVVHSLATADGIPHPTGAPEGDRMEIRRYVPGDPVRHILWKTYARTRELNVRLPERSVERARRTVAYLLTGPGDEPAAAAARVALATGALGELWLFGTDGLAEPTGELEPALLAIARSGNAANRDGETPADPEAAGLRRFLERMAAEGEVHCVIFAPARQGPWVEAALAAGRAFGGSLSFVLGTDGVVQARPVTLWRRLLLEPEALDGTPAEELAGAVRVLAGAGAHTLVVDRRSGRTFGESHQLQFRGAA